MSIPFHKQARVTGLAFAISLVAAPSQAAMTILDSPLFLTSTGVEPNVVMTLDDSGSMRRGYVPESLLRDQSIIDGPRFKSPSVNGMYYNPSITYTAPQPTPPATTYSTSFAKAYFNGFDSTKGSVDLSSEYQVIAQSRPAHQHADCTGTFDDSKEFDNGCYFAKHPNRDGLGGGTAKTAAYYYLYYQQTKTPSKPSDCSDDITDDDCYLYIDVGSGDDIAAGTSAEQEQNFANWYSFYRTRILATMSGAMTGIAALKDESVRFGWQTLNECRIKDTSCGGYDGTHTKTFAKLTSAQKTSFFDWLTRMKVTGGTPLRQGLALAGDFYQLKGVDGPYANVPGNEYQTATSPARACRKCFHIMFTDGVWNVDGETSFAFPDSTNTDPDSSGTTALPDGKTYTAMKPYKDTSMSSYTNPKGLADIAFYFWANDLNGDLDDDVKQSIVDATTETSNPNWPYWNPRNDPATWQHMSNYVIGLGLSTAMQRECVYDPRPAYFTKDPNNPTPGCPVWGGGTFEGDYNLLLSGVKNWPRINPSATSAKEPDGHVYDLWHAAINSRGKFFSAESPSDVTDAFTAIMDTISALASAGGGANLTSNTKNAEDPNGLIFQAKFREDWSGQLIAHRMSAGYATLPACADDGEQPITTCWDASKRIPIPAKRNIVTFDGSTASDFDDCATNSALAAELNKNSKGITDNLCAKRLHWLRGDAKVTNASCAYDSSTNTKTAAFTAEDHGFAAGDSVRVSGVKIDASSLSPDYNNTFQVAASSDDTFSVPLGDGDCTEVKAYFGGGRASYALLASSPTKVQARDRANSVLGDIVNSDPVYSFDEDRGYTSAVKLDGHGEYGDFVTTTKTLGTPMVYVGANDGMLHAFQADFDTSTGSNSGKEMFAYVPRAVYPKLTYLTDPSYKHTFSVDGPLTVADAYTSGSWKTFLVGALGSGGKAVFALDVTNPKTFGKSDFKWEFSGGSHPSNLGLTYSQPLVSAISSDTWAAVFGNGYASSAGQAGLFVVDLATGNEIEYLSGDTTSTDNGLSTPLLYDQDGDEIVDAVYAGDLKGNLWKFVNTLDASGNSSWTVGNAGKPLFTAAAGQPITSQPRLVNHPNGGVLLYFGTGSYITQEDLTDNTQQAFYAVWDDDNGTGTVITPSDLQSRTIVTEIVTSGSTSYSVRLTSDETLDWAATTKKGWYLQLPAASPSTAPSERIVSSPIVMEFVSAKVPDRVLFVTNTPYGDPCDEGGKTWLMELDLLTGRPTATSIFDFNNDNTFDSSDMFTHDGKSWAASGIALPDKTSSNDYGISGEPLTLDRAAPAGSQYKRVDKLPAGTTGVGGTADLPGQQGEEVGLGKAQRIYWRQIQ